MKPSPQARCCACLLIFMLSGVLILSSPLIAPPAWAFSDTHGHWAAYYIDHLTARGLIAGYPDGSFKPQDSISRAEFTTLMISVLHKHGEAEVLQSGHSSFTDCQGSWAQGSIEMARELGLVYGAQGALFAPERDTTREEAAVMLAMALDCPEADLPPLNFSDAGQIAGDARPYVACALAKGLITGLPDGSFRPDDPLSRSQVAVIMNRFLATKGEDFDFYGVVKSTESSGRMHIMTGGSEQVFDLARSAVIYDQNCVSYASLIPDNAPIYFDLDDSGEINFACLSPEVENLVNVNYVRWPDYEAESRSSAEGLILAEAPADELTLAEAPADEHTLAEAPADGLTLAEAPADGLTLAGLENDESQRTRAVEPDEQAALAPADEGLAPSLATTEGLTPAAEEIIESGRVDLDHPGSSLDVCRRAMKADLFANATGATGFGQLIAVIDSGVDPGHPDLQVTSQGQPKILDYIDLTNEGRVELAIAPRKGDLARLEGIDYNVNGISSADKIYRIGIIDKSSFPADFAAGLKMPGLAVLAVCSARAGDCDRVYLDLDGDGSFADESPLAAYSVKRQTATLINSQKGRLNLAVAELDQKGAYVKLGFDGLGHGTTVAGVAAAFGVIEGIAPGASILPVKIVNRAGAASIDLLKKAVTIAADRGARIAVISMGQAELSSYDRSSLEALARNARDNYGMLLVMAAGNNGPGLESVNESSDIGSIISVGAYATPEMWKNDYGWDVKSSTLWYFSPAGPGIRAGVAPLVVAPGSAISCYPQWSSESYRLVQGTSVAAPGLAGALALLLEASPSDDYLQKTRQVWAALLNGASPLTGYQPVEQGYGAVDLMESWENMKKSDELAPAMSVRQASPGLQISQGLYSQGLPPGQFSLSITNESDNLCELLIARAAPWMVPSQKSLQLPAQSTREFQVNYENLAENGLYSTLLVADDQETLGFDAVAMQTVVIPVQLDELPNKSAAFQSQLNPGLYQRYFFEAPEGSTELQFKLDVTGKGRVRLYVIGPDGRQHAGDYIGAGSGEKDYDYTPVVSSPGIWEAVVYSSASLSDYGLDQSDYTLTASLKKTVPAPKILDRKYLVSSLPSSLLQNIKQSMVTLHFWQPGSKLEASGIVSVNGRLYEIRDGMVQVEQAVDKERVSIEVGW